MKSKRRLSSRKASPRGEKRQRIDRDPVENGVQEALAIELIGVCLAFLERTGTEPSRFPRILALSRAQSRGEIPTVHRLLEDANRLGDLVVEWSENPEYLDAEGHPKVLAMHGRGKTFASLCKKYFGTRPARNIAEFGRRIHSIAAVGEDRVALTSSCVLFTGNPLIMTARAIEGTRRFLGTASHNSAATQPESWPERVAWGVIPKTSIPAFIQLMRRQMPALIELGHRWLESHKNRGLDSTTVGVQAFFFSES